MISCVIINISSPATPKDTWMGWKYWRSLLSDTQISNIHSYIKKRWLSPPLLHACPRWGVPARGGGNFRDARANLWLASEQSKPLARGVSHQHHHLFQRWKDLIHGAIRYQFLKTNRTLIRQCVIRKFSICFRWRTSLVVLLESWSSPHHASEARVSQTCSCTNGTPVGDSLICSFAASAYTLKTRTSFL